MKLVETARRLESNAEVESQNFGIGDASVVIEILRNRLYRHKVRTLVQEYISNARDATREINGKQRVIVSLPTPFAPTFKVRDFGPGVSPKRMSTVFIQYGASTKRDSNNQTGGFGIGAKSAWAYSDSFTITTFIDGIQRQYLAHTGANNSGRLDFLGESPTKEPNGTEIQIPVSPKDTREFVEAAHRAVYFWDKSEVPEFRGDDKTIGKERVVGELLGNLEVHKELPNYIADSYGSMPVISIDGIPYITDSSLVAKISSLDKLKQLVRNGRVILHIPNGQVEVSASREEISDSKVTLSALEQIANKSLKEVKAQISTEFAKATTPFEYLSVYVKLSRFYDLSDFSSFGDFKMVSANNGDERIESALFSSVKGERCSINGNGDVVKESLSKSGRRSRRRSNGTPFVRATEFDTLFLVSGTESAVITNYRIRAAIKAKNVPTIVVFSKLSDQAADPLALDKLKSGLGLKDIATIPYVKPPRKTPDLIKIEKTKEEFTVHSFIGRNSITSLERNKTKYVYVEYKGSQDTIDAQGLAHYLMESDLGQQLCKLSKDTIKKVQGDANFTSLDSFLKTYKISQDEINSQIAIVAQSTRTMEKLSNVSGIKNKFLTKMIGMYSIVQKSHGPTLPTILKNIVGTIKEVEAFKVQDAKLVQLLDSDLNLLSNIGWNPAVTTEIVHYINAKV